MTKINNTRQHYQPNTAKQFNLPKTPIKFAYLEQKNE